MKEIKYIYYFLFVFYLVTYSNPNIKADTYIVDTIANVESVLTAKENAVDLKTLQNMMLNKNIDIDIFIERMIQAQKKVNNARAQYFPYGLGTVAQIYFYSNFSYILIDELVTSFPSKFFRVRSRKHYAISKHYDVEVLKRDLKNQIATIYYSILKGEALLKLASYELLLLESKREVIKERILLGLSLKDELLRNQRKIYELTDLLLRFKSFHMVKRKTLNILLGRNFSDQPIELQPVNVYDNKLQVMAPFERVIDRVLYRSLKLKSSEELIISAKYGVKAVKWSILSFLGFGFGYSARVKLAQSYKKERELKYRLLEQKTINDLYVLNNSYQKYFLMFDHSLSIYKMTRNFFEGKVLNFEVGQSTLYQLIDFAIVYVNDYRQTIRHHYNSLEKKEDLRRVLLGSINEKVATEDDFRLKMYQKRYDVFVKLSIKSTNIKRKNISTITYYFDNKFRKRVIIKKSKHFFKAKIHLRTLKEHVTGTIFIRMRSGEIVKKKFEIN